MAEGQRIHPLGVQVRAIDTTSLELTGSLAVPDQPLDLSGRPLPVFRT